MSLNSFIQPGDNVDITKERQKATFPTEELTKELYGEKYAKRRREITAYVEKTKSLHDSGIQAFMTREERYADAARKTAEVFKHANNISRPGDEGFMHMTLEVFGVDGCPLALHNSMFIPALEGQAHDSLLNKYIARAKRGEIIGTYAQTELGHGTNLRSLETTAHYDKKTQEFVLNSPTLTATKWWPGNLGKSSNYAVIAANLYLDDKLVGPHNFLVQLRCEKTHELLKGITIGDIGPKLGINTTDNGFLRFDHYRISRDNMLMKHSKVLPDGTYVKPPHAKLSYGAMVHVRSYMATNQAQFLGYAVTIAIRYSAIRRQGEITPGAGEVQILDYQTQQHRLFPQIARSYAYYFAGNQVLTLFQQTLNLVKNGNVDLMADLHAVTSGIKAVISYEVGNGIEQCRMACGGHGYSQASRIPEIWASQIGGCTYEGENMVMLLQLARYLMKAAELARTGGKLSPLCEYLTKFDHLNHIGMMPDPKGDELLQAFEHISRSLVFKSFDRLTALKRQSMSQEHTWQANAVELTRASRAHTRLFLAQAFHDKVFNSTRYIDPRVQAVLEDMCKLYLNYELLDMSHYLLEDNYASSKQIHAIRENVYDLLNKIRPNAVSLVDSFEFSDRELRSVLGRRDGHVYENLLKWAKANPLNKHDVLPAVTKYLLPMTNEAKAASKL